MEGRVRCRQCRGAVGGGQLQPWTWTVHNCEARAAHQNLALAGNDTPVALSVQSAMGAAWGLGFLR